MVHYQGHLESKEAPDKALSPLLFVIYIEVLAIAIRQNSDIRGVEIGKEEHKLALYADYRIIYLTSPEKLMNHLMNVIKDFRLV
jgi:hypothetical protein